MLTCFDSFFDFFTTTLYFTETYIIALYTFHLQFTNLLSRFATCNGLDDINTHVNTSVSSFTTTQINVNFLLFVFLDGITLDDVSLQRKSLVKPCGYAVRQVANTTLESLLLGSICGRAGTRC